MATQIEALKVYMIGMEYPASLNDPSPAKPLTLAGDWRTEDAQARRRNVRNAHRHVGLVLHYDSMTHVAVIFLGSSAPRQPQRYMPWEGTNRFDYQTIEILRARGANFENHPGYLNFTHAIRVLVLQPGGVTSGTNPGLACISNLSDHGVKPPEVLDISLDGCQVELLKSLHALYWMGVRYNAGGTTEDGDEDIGSGGQHGSGSQYGSGDQHGNGGVQATNEAVAEMSMKLGRALDWEDFRNSQISMVEGDEDEDLVDIGSLPKCIIGPITEEDLKSGYFAHDFEVGFAWEDGIVGYG